MNQDSKFLSLLYSILGSVQNTRAEFSMTSNDTIFVPLQQLPQNKYSKTCLSGHSKRRPKVGFQDRLSLNAGQKYCRMLQESIL